jgi:hypothetical protein
MAGDFNVQGFAITPTQADTPLIVDPYAALAGPIAARRIQAFARQTGQVPQQGCAVEVVQLSRCRVGGRPEPPAEPAVEDIPGLAAAEEPNHGRSPSWQA